MKKRGIIVFLTGVVLLASIYLYLIFTTNAFVAKWRTIYIETAMTTNSHQWLAEWFIPQFVIDEVMADRAAQEREQKLLESTWGNMKDTESGQGENKPDTSGEADNAQQKAFYEKYWELDCDSFKEYLKKNEQLLAEGYDHIEINSLNDSEKIRTKFGDELLALDTANNTMIIGVSGEGFVGKLAVVKNMEQVTLQTSAYYGTRGESAEAYSKKYDAEVVVNASGFKDVGGHGSGGIIKGSYVLDGVENGAPQNGYWKFVGVKNDNKMYIGNRENTEISDYKWGIEFYPALIVDGENVIDGSYCMGIQPRTTIGQTLNGDMLLLVVDGRQIGYSLGCSVADCEEILRRYNAWQAMNLDGGSSSVMYYKGQMITKPSSASGLGRYMPNAIVVRKTGEQ